MIWKVIKTVHEAYRGISSRLAELTGTSPEWWRSHGRAPSTFNEQNTGKKWQPVEDYVKAIDLYEEAFGGAGIMLSEEINQMIRCRYSRCEKVAQAALVNSMIKESSEAVLEVNKRPFEQMNTMELETARNEVAQALEASKRALDVLDRMINERRNIRRDSFGDLKSAATH